VTAFAVTRHRRAGRNLLNLALLLGAAAMGYASVTTADPGTAVGMLVGVGVLAGG
jgi:hypothetical protein